MQPQRPVLISLLAVLLASTFAATSTVNFSTGREVPTGIADIADSAVADLNGDGKKDIVSVGSGEVRILLATGDGLFREAGKHVIGEPAGGTARQVRLVDVNRDSKLDIVVTHYEGNRVAILLGHGDGTFNAAMRFAPCVGSGLGPASVAVADFNRDGKMDLAVACNESPFPSPGRITILAGNGDGTFRAPVDRGPSAGMLDTGDFNGDGIPDLVTGGTVLIGKGNGTFKAPNVIGPGFYVVVADLNADGKPDFAATSCEGECIFGELTVALNRGDGTFDISNSDRVTDVVAGITAGDVNGDGIIDLVIADVGIGGSDMFDPGFLDVRLGTGGGAFVGPIIVRAATSNSNVTAADLNNDGFADLLVPSGSNIEVITGGKHGPIQPAGIDNFIFDPSHAAIGDLNGDGLPDIAIAANASNAGDLGDFSGFCVLYNRGNGTFSPQDGAPGSFGSVTIADLDGKGGANDLVLSSFDRVAIYLRVGDAYVLKEEHFHTGPVVVADFNHDGKVDIATASGWLLLNRGNGTFSEKFAFDAGGLIGVGDFNADGNEDVIAGSISTIGFGGSITVFLGDGRGRFSPKATYTDIASFVVADLNGDGRLDLATGDGASHLSLRFGRGDGTFHDPILQPSGGDPVATGDFDGDGRPDLLIGTTILLNNGAGSFKPAGTFAEAPDSIAAGDLNNDGVTDLVFTKHGETGFQGVISFSGQIHVLTNTTGTFVRVAKAAGPAGSVNLTATVRPTFKELPYNPTGTVTFFDGNVAVGTAKVSNGQARLTGLVVRPGTHHITARYSGSRLFNAKFSTTLVFETPK